MKGVPTGIFPTGMSPAVMSLVFWKLNSTIWSEVRVPRGTILAVSDSEKFWGRPEGLSPSF
jgi:hypothetical protein